MPLCLGLMVDLTIGLPRVRRVVPDWQENKEVAAWLMIP